MHPLDALPVGGPLQCAARNVMFSLAMFSRSAQPEPKLRRDDHGKSFTLPLFDRIRRFWRMKSPAMQTALPLIQKQPAESHRILCFSAALFEPDRPSHRVSAPTAGSQGKFILRLKGFPWQGGYRAGVVKDGPEIPLIAQSPKPPAKHKSRPEERPCTMASHGLLKLPKLRTPSVGVSLSAPPTPLPPKAVIYTQDETGLSCDGAIDGPNQRRSRGRGSPQKTDFARHSRCSASLKTGTAGCVQSQFQKRL